MANELKCPICGSNAELHYSFVRIRLCCLNEKCRVETHFPVVNFTNANEVLRRLATRQDKQGIIDQIKEYCENPAYTGALAAAHIQMIIEKKG